MTGASPPATAPRRSRYRSRSSAARESPSAPGGRGGLGGRRHVHRYERERHRRRFLRDDHLGRRTDVEGTFSYDATAKVWNVLGVNTYAEEGLYPVSVAISDFGATSKRQHDRRRSPTHFCRHRCRHLSDRRTDLLRQSCELCRRRPRGDRSRFLRDHRLGDGHTSAGTIGYDTTTHLFDVTGSNTYGEEGPTRSRSRSTTSAAR